MEREHLYTLPGKDEVYRYNEAVVVEFGGKRHVLSTGGMNGGYAEHLTHVFNHKSGYNYCTHPEDAPCTYREYLTDFVENKLGLSLKTTAGMATIVSMQNVCIETRSFRDITVTAIATASLEVNGGRVCDPAEYYEEADPAKPGTINIMLHVNANMSPGCMARTVLTLTEAKTAAIQELMGSSLYSSGIATGSGSDSVIVLSNAESDFHLTYAGKHSKLGELIGITVKTAVTKALAKHMDLTPQTQHSVGKRTFRYGLTAEHYWETYLHSGGQEREKQAFLTALASLDKQDGMVVWTSLYIHLMDQVSWGLLTIQEANDPAARILECLAHIAEMDRKKEEDRESKPGLPTVQPLKEAFTRLMVEIGSHAHAGKGDGKRQ